MGAATIDRTEFSSWVSLREARDGSLRVSVDEDEGVIKNVRLLGRRSPNRPNRNGRPMPGVTDGTFYSDSALDTAADIFEGAKVRLNHPDRSRPNEDRSVEDDFAIVRNVSRDAGGLRGDLHYNRAHPFAARLVEDVKRKLGQWGLSPNALGVGHVERGVYVVDELAHCRSIDLVSDPATTVNLWESKEPQVATITASELFERLLTKKTPLNRLKLVAFMESACMKGKPGSVMEGDDPSGAPMGGDAPLGDAPVPEPAPEDDHDEMLRSGFEGVMTKVIQDALSGGMDPKAALNRLKELLMAHHGINGKGGDKGGGGSEVDIEPDLDEESKPKAGDMAESDACAGLPEGKDSGGPKDPDSVKKSKMNTTQVAESRNTAELERRELERYRRRDEVVTLCESLDYQADGIEIKAMVDLSESDRRAFIVRQKKTKNRPRTTIPSREEDAPARRDKPMAEGATALADAIKR